MRDRGRRGSQRGLPGLRLNLLLLIYYPPKGRTTHAVKCCWLRHTVKRCLGSVVTLWWQPNAIIKKMAWWPQVGAPTVNGSHATSYPILSRGAFGTAVGNHTLGASASLLAKVNVSAALPPRMAFVTSWSINSTTPPRDTYAGYPPPPPPSKSLTRSASLVHFLQYPHAPPSCLAHPVFPILTRSVSLTHCFQYSHNLSPDLFD